MLKIIVALVSLLVAAAPAMAETCQDAQARVHGLVQNPPAGTSDQDLLSAEELLGRARVLCEQGDEQQSLELLDQASSLFGQ